jgi:hypothetical protein
MGTCDIPGAERSATDFEDVPYSLKRVKNCQSTYFQSQCLQIQGRHSRYLQCRLCVVPVLANTNFNFFSHKKCVLFQKFLVLLESPDRHSLLVAVTPLSHCPSLNAPKSLGVPELSHST